MPSQMYVGRVLKGPTERLDWTENWAKILNPIEDTIVDLSVSVDPPDIPIWSETFTDMDTTAMVDVGGTVGQNYTLSFDITTANDRKFRRSIQIKCVPR